MEPDLASDDGVYIAQRLAVGAVILVALSFLQKLVLGAPVLTPTGYVVPALFGGGTGFVYGYYSLGRKKRIQQLDREIAERKRTEGDLRRFRRASEAAGHAVYITDQQGTIEYVNPAFEEITGYTASEAVGETPQILNSGEMADEYYERLWESITGGDVWKEEVVNRRKDGDIYYAYQTIAPIPNERGDTEAFVAIQTDVTDRKTLETELVETKERYESLFDSIRDAILVADTDWRIQNCNPAFSNLFGYDLAEVEKNHVSHVYQSDEEFEEMCESIDGQFGDPRATCTVNYRKKSGQVFPGETNVFYHRNAEDEVIGFIVLVRDVSEHKERLRQIQVLDRVLRHNLTNKMQVVWGAAEMVERSGNEEIEPYVETIMETSEQLLETTDKERAITQLLREPPGTITLDVVRVAREAISGEQTRHPDANIRPDLPEQASVVAVPAISRAIEELVENAIVHSDQDCPTVDVSVETAGDTVAVSVADDGPGIPEMERQVLTDQAEIEPLYHGSGLGLRLVNLIVRQSDGWLDIEPNDPRGSVVTVRFQRP
jgi:PAS domain S-box-containing protein